MADPIDFTDYTALADTLKTTYGDGLTNQFEDETTTWNQFPVSSRKCGGEGYNFGVRYSRAQSVGARTEGEKLPDPLVGKFDKGRILPVKLYGSMKISGYAIEAAKGNMNAFVDGLADGIDDVYQAFVVDLNRQAWGDGFGLLGTLSAASDTLSTSADWTVTMDNTAGVQYLQAGMLVDFFDGASVDQSSVASRISSIDHANNTCEMEKNDGTYKTNHPNSTFAGYSIAADAVPDGAYMVKMATRDASHASSDTPREITGLLGIYDDGTLLDTFENINADSYEEWQANKLGNSSVDRPLSIDLMLQGVNVVRSRSGKQVKTIRMGLGQRRNYANLLIPDRRFMDSNLRGGYEELSFAAGDGAIKMVIDPMAQPGKIFMEPDGVIQRYELAPLGWIDYDQVMHMRAGYDEYSMYLRLFANLGCEQRNCLAVIEDLTEPSLY